MFFFMYYNCCSTCFAKIAESFPISSEKGNLNSLKGQIYRTLKEVNFFGARMAGTSLTKAAEMSVISRTVALKVMRTFEKEGKTPPG